MKKIGIFTLVLAGCSSGASPGADTPAPGAAVEASPPPAAGNNGGTTESTANRLLWAEDLGAEHTLQVYESGVGGWAALESGPTGAPQLVTPEIARAGLASVYAAFRPGANMPAVLAELDTRVRAAERETLAAPAEAPPEAAASGEVQTGQRTSSVRVPMTAAQSQPFMSAHCDRRFQADCISGYDWMSTGTTPGWDTPNWTSFGQLGSEAVASAPFRVNGYVCYSSGLFGLGNTCSWRVLASTTLRPGYWQGWNGNTNTVYSQYSADINWQGSNGVWQGTHTYATVDIVLLYTLGAHPAGGGGCSGSGCSWAFP